MTKEETQKECRELIKKSLYGKGDKTKWLNNIARYIMACVDTNKLNNYIIWLEDIDMAMTCDDVSVKDMAWLFKALAGCNVEQYN